MDLIEDVRSDGRRRRATMAMTMMTTDGGGDDDDRDDDDVDIERGDVGVVELDDDDDSGLMMPIESLDTEETTTTTPVVVRVVADASFAAKTTSRCDDGVDEAEEEEASMDARLAVALHEVRYEVRHHSDARKKLTLLNDVSCAFPPGSLSALMGPSGAGKTTLLDVISGRKTQGELTGRIVVGKEPASKEALKSCAAYVEQFDCLLPSLTVRETLIDRKRHV